jgi:hypothetical protein
MGFNGFWDVTNTCYIVNTRQTIMSPNPSKQARQSNGPSKIECLSLASLSSVM